MDMKQLRLDEKQQCSGVNSPSGLERSASSGARKDEEDDAAIDSRNKRENLEKSESNNYGISREDIQKHAGKRLRDVANIYGISLSAMKQVCRNHGIVRWPVRPIRRLPASKVQKFKHSLYPQVAGFDDCYSGVEPNSPSLDPKGNAPNYFSANEPSSPISAAQDNLDP